MVGISPSISSGVIGNGASSLSAEAVENPDRLASTRVITVQSSHGVERAEKSGDISSLGQSTEGGTDGTRDTILSSTTEESSLVEVRPRGDVGVVEDRVKVEEGLEDGHALLGIAKVVVVAHDQGLLGARLEHDNRVQGEQAGLVTGNLLEDGVVRDVLGSVESGLNNKHLVVVGRREKLVSGRDDDAKVGTSSTNTPEQVGVDLLGGLDDVAISSDETDGQKRIDEEAVDAQPVADTTTEGDTDETGAGAATESCWNCQSES